jgi:hypothetical protein
LSCRKQHNATHPTASAINVQPLRLPEAPQATADTRGLFNNFLRLKNRRFM